MRILLVNYEYPPLGGGGGVLTKTLADELARRHGHEVTVLTSRTGALPADAYEGHVRVVRAPVAGRREQARASMTSLLSFVPSARRAGAALTRTNTYDVVHSFFAVPTGPAGAAVARRIGAPHVLTVVGADIYDPSRLDPSSFAPLRATVRAVVRRAHAVTAISNDIAARARQLSGRDDIPVVHCGIPPAALPARERASPGRDPKAFVVVTIARLVRRKALDVLVRAVDGLDNVRLEVIGDGPERENLESIGAANVRFAGPLSDAEVGERLAASDAFALVSQHEGFGLVYLEAMRAALPVIAGTHGGQTDFLEDGENAVLVEPGDERALRTAIERLRDDHDFRVRLRAHGHETVASYSAQSMADAYLEVYRGVQRNRAPLARKD